MSEGRSLALATGNDQAVYNFELTTHGVQMSACRARDNLVYPALTCATQQLGNAEVEDGGLVLAVLNGHVLGRKPENGGNSSGHASGDVMLTETATDVHAVAVLDPGHCKVSPVAGTVTGSHDSRITDATNVVVGFAYKQGSKSGSASAHEDEAPTLRGGQPDAAVGFVPFAGAKASAREGDELSTTLDTWARNVGVSANAHVRRLMPEECERLMGYPEGHTRVPYRGKPADQCPDGPRYEACGNGWAINCARWVLLGIHRYFTTTKEHNDE